MTQGHCTPCDFGVFLSLWNATQNYKTPKIHFRIATWLQKCWERGQTRLLLQAFRGGGKSTIAALFCAWILIRDPDLRILVLSAESKLAQKMVRSIRKVIEKHPLTTNLRPDTPDQWASDSFTVKRGRVSRDPSVLARGIYANLTGARADIIICDDVEVPNTSDTWLKRDDLRERLLENEFILTPGGTILFIGTPHTYYTIYATKPRKEIGETRSYLCGYARLAIPVLTQSGRSRWPERFDTKKIEEIKAASGNIQFSSQMMLEPRNIIESRLDINLLQPYSHALSAQEAQQSIVLKMGDKKIVSCSAWWDPSFGAAGNDSSVLAVVYTDENGAQYLHRVVYIKTDDISESDAATQQCESVCNHCDELFVPVLYIETNGIGKFLPSILRKVMDARKIPTSIVEKNSIENKSKRILKAFDCAMAARALNVHASVYQTPFVDEMTEWRPFVSGLRDDGLDAAAGALSAEPLRIKKNAKRAAKVWVPSGSSFTATTEFDV